MAEATTYQPSQDTVDTDYNGLEEFKLPPPDTTSLADIFASLTCGSSGLYPEEGDGTCDSSGARLVLDQTKGEPEETVWRASGEVGSTYIMYMSSPAL